MLPEESTYNPPRFESWYCRSCSNKLVQIDTSVNTDRRCPLCHTPLGKGISTRLKHDDTPQHNINVTT